MWTGYFLKQLRESSLKRLIVSAAVSIGTLSFALAPTQVAANSQSPSKAQLSDASFIKEGHDLFVHTCSYCHGEAGDAGKNKPFRDHLLNWDPEDIHDTIVEGRINGANVMPSWGDSIEEENIWKIVAYIHSLEGQKSKITKNNN